jgi:hypothetical protein
MLLANVAAADRQTVARNFESMASRETLSNPRGGCKETSSISMLDFFPGLESWMFLELLEVAGNELMHRIACKVMEAPYDCLGGWPDLTIWKDRARSVPPSWRVGVPGRVGVRAWRERARRVDEVRISLVTNSPNAMTDGSSRVGFEGLKPPKV